MSEMSSAIQIRRNSATSTRRSCLSILANRGLFNAETISQLHLSDTCFFSDSAKQIGEDGIVGTVKRVESHLGQNRREF